MNLYFNWFFLLLLRLILELLIYIYKYVFTVDRKNIRALEINCVKNSYLMQFYKINVCQVMILRFYTVYNKQAIWKIGNQTREKLQVFSQVLELFCCRLYAYIYVLHNKWKHRKTYVLSFIKQTLQIPFLFWISFLAYFLYS